MANYGTQFRVCNQAVNNFTKVATIEYVKAVFDFDLASKELKMLCNNTKEHHQVMSTFVLALTAKWGAEEIHGMLKGWGSSVIRQIEAEGFDDISAVVLRKINEIIQTESCQVVLDMGITVFLNLIKELKNQEVSTEFRVTSISEIESFTIPSDKTKVVTPILR